MTRVVRLWQVKTVAPGDRQYSVFVGAAILASLTTFQQVRAMTRMLRTSDAMCFGLSHVLVAAREHAGLRGACGTARRRSMSC